MATIPNVQGFEDMKFYKFRSVGDSNVIQVESGDGNNLVCMLENREEDDAQKFRALSVGNGKYHILPKVQKSGDMCQVWDCLPHREFLILRKESSADKFTQHWSSHKTVGMNSFYLDQSHPGSDLQKCLKNVGAGRHVEVVNRSDNSVRDNFLRWYLDLVDE